MLNGKGRMPHGKSHIDCRRKNHRTDPSRSQKLSEVEMETRAKLQSTTGQAPPRRNLQPSPQIRGVSWRASVASHQLWDWMVFVLFHTEKASDMFAAKQPIHA
jgi:hypothetical protein